MNFEIAPSPSPIPMIVLSAFKSIEENPALFDFNLFINEDNVIINSTSQIYRTRRDQYIRGKKLQVVKKSHAMNGDLPDFDFQTLFSLKLREQDQYISYVLEKPENVSQFEVKSELLQNMPFISLNGHGRINEVRSYPIIEGDIIRLGKSYLRILQTHLNNKRMPQLPQLNQGSIVRAAQSVEDCGSLAKVCRICLMESEEDDQVISPCSCKGSCKFVHFHCLKTWFQNKVTSHSNRLVTAYSLAKFECQICKTPLANKINIKGRQQLLVDLRKPEQPYIILQKINFQSKEKNIFVLTPKGVGVKIGRGNSADLKINDPTISRLHAIIEFRRGEFVINDMGSRFGTLILMREDIVFHKIMCLQWRNKLYKLQVRQTINSRAQAYLG